MDQNSLVIEEADAGAEFVSRFNQSIPVKVAFWVKPVESGQWYLYIASQQIDDRSIDQGYREVLRLAIQDPNPYLDPFQVKLIPASDPLAQAALEIHQRFPGKTATRIRNKIFGGMNVDFVYVYPAPVVAPTP